MQYTCFFFMQGFDLQGEKLQVITIAHARHGVCTFIKFYIMGWWGLVAYNKVPKQIILTGLNTRIRALIQDSFVERIA